MTYMCESQKLLICWPYIRTYLQGNGVDLGAGHVKVKPEALGIDFGSNGHSWVGDVTQLIWFKDNVLDYVFSSHCLEHVIDDVCTLQEWLRVLKPGGWLVLYVPDDDIFDNKAMIETGEHKHVYTVKSLKELLEKVGAKVEQCKQHKGEVPNYPGQHVYSVFALARKE
jgi:predicted SAM-dependent methyltransferase